MPLGEVVLDRPHERVRKGTVDTYLISARRAHQPDWPADGRSHAEIGRWDVLVDIPQPVDEHPDFDPRNDYSLKGEHHRAVRRRAQRRRRTDPRRHRPRLDDVTEHVAVLLVDQRPELRKGVAILGAVGPLLAGNHIVECRHPDDDPVKVQLRGTSDELRV